MENLSVRETVEMPEFPAASGSIGTDALIVGGGIAGLLTAYELQKSGVSCVVAERFRIGSGTTRGTTAKLTFRHGLIYQKILRAYGAERARMYLEANQNALKRYAELCRKIDCGFRKTDGFIYSRDDANALEREVRALARIGFSADVCRVTELPFPTVGAVRFKNQAVFEPPRFLRGLVGEMSERVRIFEHTRIMEINGKTALSRGARITADKIVIATHFPFVNAHGSYFPKMYRSRSDVIALKNAPRLSGIYMDENVYSYSFGSFGELLLIGGEAHKTGEPCRRKALQDFAKRAYPGAEPQYLWSAQDCITLDGIPYIGNYSALTPNMYVAAGFNKWGLTNAMAAAEILRDKILGKDNPYAAVFDPSRGILKKQLAINGLNAAKNLLTPTVPRCPHLGCALKWNADERSWDCPCHGSRFARDGRLLESPAATDLNKP
ncbi:MAG: FAD-dependent oxidoreductase [Lachnospiraceae bacterium]|nr:FAD-dependent oxidoreductase [Ruminococcus sp.]MCM1273815.1 FAD-dependent oxidoreductase [Lachnospiraceae bacterium]